MKKIDRLVEKMNGLMIRKRNRFIEQYLDKNGNAKWHQRTTTITDNIIRDHLEAKHTIGVFYAGGGTAFLFFDIDAKGDPVGQEIRVKGILTALKRAGISEEYIHVMFSGNKGYHVQLFFDDLLPINSVATFGRAIIDQLNEYSSGIELRPESVNGRGVKLPLALHQATGAFAYYVDHTLEMVQDSQDYFLAILPMPKDQMRAAIDKVLSEAKSKQSEQPESLVTNIDRPKRVFAEMPIPNGESSGLRDTAERILIDGLQEKGTRHDSQFLLALYFKGLGTPLERAITEMSEWIETQWLRKMTNEDDLDYLLSEVKRQVTNVYNDPKYTGLYDNRGRPPVMTLDDAKWVASFPRKNLRRVLWAILLIGRMYHEEGYFSADMNSIASLTGLVRQTASKRLNQLMIAGVIDKVSEPSYSRHRASEYFMARLGGEDSAEAVPIPYTGSTVGEVYNETSRIMESMYKRPPRVQKRSS